MARYAPVALVAALLVATGAAFSYTEKLKLTKSPVFGTQVDKVFSPVCDCAQSGARVAFKLRHADTLSVDIVSGGARRVVRTLVDRNPTPRGEVEVFWDGRDDSGRIVPEGRYEPRLRLGRQRRTIVLPNPIEVDVTPPEFERFTLRPRVFSPDGDGRSDTVEAGYRLSEPGQVALYVNGRRQVLKRGTKPEAEIRWFGSIDGERAAPGVVPIALGATDVAGNPAQRTPPRPIVVRYVALGRKRIAAVAGSRFAVLVAADSRRIRWRLGARRGVVKPGTLRLRAPLRPGRYALVVEVGERRARATLIVRAGAQAP